MLVGGDLDSMCPVEMTVVLTGAGRQGWATWCVCSIRGGVVFEIRC